MEIKNKRIATCIICGLTASIIFQSTPYCQRCHAEKHDHLPEKNYETGLFGSSHGVSMSGVNASASPSPPPTSSTTTLEDYE